MPQISDATLKQALANALGVAVGSLAAKWDAMVTEANDDAYNAIQRALAARGYTTGQIDSWDDSAEFNRDIGLFWVLTRGGGLQGYDDRNINKLDRRKELETVAVTIGGLVVVPGETARDPVGRGRLRNRTDVFPSDDLSKIKW